MIISNMISNIAIPGATFSDMLNLIKQINTVCISKGIYCAIWNLQIHKKCFKYYKFFKK